MATMTEYIKVMDECIGKETGVITRKQIGKCFKLGRDAVATLVRPLSKITIGEGIYLQKEMLRKHLRINTPNVQNSFDRILFRLNHRQCRWFSLQIAFEYRKRYIKVEK